LRQITPAPRRLSKAAPDYGLSARQSLARAFGRSVPIVLHLLFLLFCSHLRHTLKTILAEEFVRINATTLLKVPAAWPACARPSPVFL
jgi:hypothetical protein